MIVKCSWCGKEISRPPSVLKINKNNYCTKKCRTNHISKATNPEGYTRHPHLSELNKQINKNRMIKEVRLKIRNSRLNKGKGMSYEKLYGRHKHRVVAEQKIGRKLIPGEVVHHIDGDKRNNKPNNLMVFRNQQEHAKWHKRFNDIFSNPGVEEGDYN